MREWEYSMPLEMISARDVQLAIKSRCRGRKKDDYLCAVLDILRELHGDPRLQWTVNRRAILTPIWGESALNFDPSPGW